jgi:hypothetical protein
VAELDVRLHMRSALQRLTDWYSQQCNGEWEHGYGFTIGTLDNPGVSLKVELQETNLESVPFEGKKEYPESSDRWMICRRREHTFEGFGATNRLEDIIEEFLKWAELHKKQPNQPSEPTTSGSA